MKSEPDVYSIQDLQAEKSKTCDWEGVRNYQARNFMKDMQKGDQVLFYHSNAKPPGIVGYCTINKTAYPDETSLDKKSNYFDSKSTKEINRWVKVDLKLKKVFSEILSLDFLRGQKTLKDMLLLKKGSRLSVQPVKKTEFDKILKLAGVK